MSTCSATDCEREAVAKGLCMGHYQRARRGKPSPSPLRPRGDPAGALFRASLALADAETDEDFVRLRERLRGASRNHARSRSPIRK